MKKSIAASLTWAAVGYIVVGAGLGRFASDLPAPASAPAGGEFAAQTISSARSASTAEPLSLQISRALKLMGADPSWAEALAAGDASGFPVLFEQMRALPKSQTVILTSFLLARWAALDPEGGAGFFKDREDQKNLGSLFCGWAQIDFAAAAAKAPEFGEQILRDTLATKARLDPAGFLRWINDHPEINPVALFGPMAPGKDLEALRCLAQLDKARVLAWAEELPEDQWMPGLPRLLAEGMAEDNPEEAVAWARALTNSRNSRAAIAGVAEAIAATDPERALELLADMGSNMDQGLWDSYQSFIKKSGLSADPDKAVAAMEKLPRGDLRGLLAAGTLSLLLRDDPARAFALSESFSPGNGSITFNWEPPGVPSASDARRLLEAAEQAADSTFRRRAVEMTLQGWLQRDPTGLGAYLEEQTDSKLLGSMKADLQRSLARMAVKTGQEIDPVLAKAAGLKPEHFISGLKDSDPAGAAIRFDQSPDAAGRAKLAGEIAAAWTGRDRNDALDWAMTLQNPAEQAAAWKPVAARWLAEDSHKASGWIATLPAGAGRDAAVKELTSFVARTDPDLSWKWALSMTDATLKSAALGNAAREWKRRDAEAFHGALEESGLSADERLAVLQQLQAPAPRKQGP